ncbi:hypothetical protein CLV56_3723 [Mumia flava]|uniref:Uncharacterized protein n=1 Tax=Mumia flava TaxID=1348852 RepID=A0A0B2BQP0_9ACTN|nr:hypothetical protein [Mumia flava]PJJ54215.1 hypothetical protein CLV56_3723 [Mumia flava]
MFENQIPRYAFLIVAVLAAVWMIRATPDQPPATVADQQTVVPPVEVTVNPGRAPRGRGPARPEDGAAPRTSTTVAAPSATTGTTVRERVVRTITRRTRAAERTRTAQARLGGADAKAPPSVAVPAVIEVVQPRRPKGEEQTVGAAGGTQVIATAGSIVYVGDDGQMYANTGAAASGGVIGLGVDDSDLRSGRVTVPADLLTSVATIASAPNHGNGSFELLRADDGRAISISGFEDHSVSVIGDDQIVTYDDSNVFIARDGQINANTGDTDSSGLNAVDVIGSYVRSGNSGDGEEPEDDEDEDEEDRDDDGEQSSDDLEDSAAGRQSAQAAATLATDDDDEDDDGDDSDESSEEAGHAGRGTYSEVTDEGASVASGDQTLVIGADGFDDVSIRSYGSRNIVTYDDSNVVIGGTGKVNAQIGDSDTGGAVVMGIVYSTVTAGCEGDLCYSVLAPTAQAGGHP